jgi:hypothetical protein
VRDTGAGIETSRLDRLFELFSQGTSGSTDAGLGIGLWLAKTLTEMHSGTIRAASDGPGKGTQFLVELPCLPQNTGRKTDYSKRILIVEDDPDQRELWLLVLSEMDAEVATAKDGAEALRISHRWSIRRLYSRSKPSWYVLSLLKSPSEADFKQGREIDFEFARKSESGRALEYKCSTRYWDRTSPIARSSDEVQRQPSNHW